MTLLGKMTGVAGDLATKAGNLKDVGIEKVKATVEELNTTLPHAREVGYCVTRVSLELGLTPKIAVTLCKVFDVEEERFDAVLKELAQYKVFCTVLSALRQVNNLQAKIQFRGRCLKEVEIELGLPPSVKMVFLEVQPAGPGPQSTRAGRGPLTEEEAAPDAALGTAAAETTETQGESVMEIVGVPPESEPAPEVPPPPATEPARTGTIAMTVAPAAPETNPIPEPELPEGLTEMEQTPVREGPRPPALDVPEAPPLLILETPAETRSKAAPAPPVPGTSMIHFRCFGCNHRVRAPGKSVGRLARCKKCGALLTIPAASG
jgi:hypothetical protein